MKNKFEFVSNTGDDLLQAVCKCKKSGEKFMQQVQSAPEGIVVISSDTQIKDFARFCALPPRGLRSVFCRPDFQTGGLLRDSDMI